MKRHILSMFELLQKHIRMCLSKTFFDGSDVEKENLRDDERTCSLYVRVAAEAHSHVSVENVF